MTLVTRDTRLICVETGEYPLFLDDFKTRENAVIGSSIDSEALVDFGYFPVEETPRPTEGNVITEAAPLLDEATGTWKRVWTVRQYNEEEFAAFLQQSKDSMQYKIDQFRNEQFAIGFPHLFPDGEIYHAQVNTVGRGNISDLRTLAKEAIATGAPFQVVFRTYENVNVTLNAEETVELGNAAAQHVQAGYALSWQLKDATKAATTLEEIPELPESLFTL
jgi:hypothetical protein